MGVPSIASNKWRRFKVRDVGLLAKERESRNREQTPFAGHCESRSIVRE